MTTADWVPSSHQVLHDHHGASPLPAVLTCTARWLCLSLIFILQLTVEPGSTAAASPAQGTMAIHQSAINPRYVETAGGRVLYLTGGYEGSELQDSAFGSGPRSDFKTALAILSKHDGNLLRLWSSESTGGVSGKMPASPMPWMRSEVCCAADGGHKFDLSRLDTGNLTDPDIDATHYFERMRARVLAAQDKGIYVSIMLWHSFGWENSLRIPGSRSWDAHPFNARNNINGVDADLNGDGQGLELGSVGRPFTSYQEAYVREVLEAVGDLDNVLYEICNECDDSPETNAWQAYFIDFIQQAEASQGVRHLVGMTSLQNFNNAVLVGSAADFISPGGPAFEERPPENTTGRVSILDMDHIVPCTGANSPQWPWKAFLRGHNLWYIYCSGYGSPNEREAVVLTRMAQTQSYASRVELRGMVPETDPTRCSSRYCLMGPNQVLGFVPGGGSITLMLDHGGTWSVEWFNPQSGNTFVGSSIREATVTLTPPFAGEGVVFLVRNRALVSVADR